MEFTTLSVGDLKFFKENPKKFSSKQFGRLRKSVENYDWTVPLVVNRSTKTVLDGNQRLKVAMQIGVKNLPVILIDIPKKEEALFVASLNKTHMPEDPELMMKILLKYTGNKLADEFAKDYADLENRVASDYNPEFEIVKEVNEQYSYLVFIAKKEVDFLNLETFFNLGKVYDQHKGKMIGLGRVVDSEQLTKLVDLAIQQGYKNVNEIE